MPSRKRPYAVLIEDHSEDEYEDYDGSSVIFIDDEDVDILIDTDTDDPGGHDYGHFTPMLCEFFRVLHEAGIRAVEWGAGLAESMGAPVVVIVSFMSFTREAVTTHRSCNDKPNMPLTLCHAC